MRLRRSRVRARRGPVSVTWVPPASDETTRVAYAVGRRVGGAVVRNRTRRRLRAAVGEVRSLLRPGAYLIGASLEACELGYEDLKASVSDAMRVVAARAAIGSETA